MSRWKLSTFSHFHREHPMVFFQCLSPFAIMLFLRAVSRAIRCLRIRYLHTKLVTWTCSVSRFGLPMPRAQRYSSVCYASATPLTAASTSRFQIPFLLRSLLWARHTETSMQVLGKLVRRELRSRSL